MTPRKLGLNLGQKCANLYAMGNQVQAGFENPQNIEKAVTYIEKLEKNA